MELACITSGYAAQRRDSGHQAPPVHHYIFHGTFMMQLRLFTSGFSATHSRSLLPDKAETLFSERRALSSASKIVAQVTAYLNPNS